MKPLPTKKQIRQELEQQVQQYLESGGAVENVPRGLSGRNDNQNPFTQYSADKPSQARTPVTDVIKSMEERKNPKPITKKRPKKRLITDDFGEPLRWVWDEE